MPLTSNNKTGKVIKKISNPKQEVSASKIEKVGKDIVTEQHFSTSSLPDDSGVPSTPPCYGVCSVSFGKRQVVNMGNFETITLDMTASMECTEKDMNKTYDKVKDFVEGRMEIEIDEIYKTRDGGGFL